MTYPMSGPSLIMNTDETLAVIRESSQVGAGVNYVDGKPVQDETLYVRFNLVCNVQPLSGRDLLLLPEGQRFVDQFYVWSNQRDMALDTGDLVLRDGKTYQCQSTEDWGSYTRGLCTLVDTTYLADADVEAAQSWG